MTLLQEGFVIYIRPLYNEVPLYLYMYSTVFVVGWKKKTENTKENWSLGPENLLSSNNLLYPLLYESTV